MRRAGLSREQALARFYLVDKQGLLTEETSDLTEFQQPYARRAMTAVDLESVVRAVKPTVLIGCSSQGGSFTETMVKVMAAGTERPIIFPLSNPTEKAEATPLALLQWTKGRALIATGSPFGNVEYNAQTFRIAQCNNALIYPGIGLGVVVAKATRLSDAMLWKACQALSNYSLDSGHVHHAALLPDFDHIHPISRHIALRVAEQARQEGLAQVSDTVDFAQHIQSQFWLPRYYHYRYCPEL